MSTVMSTVMSTMTTMTSRNNECRITRQRPGQGSAQHGIRPPQTRENLMHRAANQENQDHQDRIYARQRVTEATGVVACLACGEPATVIPDIRELRSCAPLCDVCAVSVIAYAHAKGYDVALGGVRGATVVTMVEGVDLAQLVVAVLDGAVGETDLRRIVNVPTAVTAVLTVLSAKVSRPLRPSEQVGVIVATTTEYVGRLRAKRANLVEAQRVFHDPMTRFFDARVG